MRMALNGCEKRYGFENTKTISEQRPEFEDSRLRRKIAFPNREPINGHLILRVYRAFP